MDDVVKELIFAAEKCEQASKRFDEPTLDGLFKSLDSAIEAVGAAASGSWVGYQAHVYITGLRPKMPGEHFDSEWGQPSGIYTGMNKSRGQWTEYSFDDVYQAIIELAGADRRQVDNIASVADDVETTTNDCRLELLPTLDAVLRNQDDLKLREIREKVEKLQLRIPQKVYVKAMLPKGQLVVRDSRARQGGVQIPPHVSLQTWLMEKRSTSFQAKELADFARYAAKYLQKAVQMKAKTASKTEGPIFIGHGRSTVWTDLREFITTRLKLKYEEFNREPTAGRSTKERLLEMLDRCPFAFLVMTGEDEQKDSTIHARANVIHEAGLFQGRHGFERAIILLEDGCEEFSNVSGVGQIRFPKGNIGAKSEEIRRVLEREGLL